MRPVVGYQGLYEVSNTGRVKSLYTGKVLKAHKEKSGHLRLGLKKNKKETKKRVHDLVAQAFIPNPENKPEVHHINFIPWDNRVENLMWVTRKEHLALHRAKKVYRYNLDGTFVDEWESACEIQRKLGLLGGHIQQCCIGKRAMAYNYQWSYEKYDRIQPLRSRQERIAEKTSKTVYQYTLDGVLVNTWKSATEVKRALKYCNSHISSCCKGICEHAYGYKWSYIELQ